MWPCPGLGERGSSDQWWPVQVLDTMVGEAYVLLLS